MLFQMFEILTVLHRYIKKYLKLYFKQFETILFLQDMIQDIYKLHWNIIHKPTGVT